MKLLIGARIRSFRKQRGLSQAILAQKVGISASYLNLIEHDKRTVAGKLLSDLAYHLEVNLDQLTRGITTDMIERLQQTARQLSADNTDDLSELRQIDQFVTHFPAWAHLLDQQILSHERLEQLNELLSDRMSHDPVLSETLHIMLSNITAIRASSELLVMQGNMAEEQRTRFQHNIFLESKRLSATAEKLLLHFDAKTESQSQSISPNVTKNNKVDSKPHQKQTPPPDEKTALPLPASLAADEHFQKTRSLLTSDSFKSESLKVSRHHFNPFIIADILELPVRHVFFRLAELGGAPDMPQFGLLEIDNASGVLYRYEAGAFRLPSRSGACPRWPIYRALGVIGQPVAMRLQLNSGELFAAYAWAESSARRHSQLAPVSRSLMLFHEYESAKSSELSVPLIEVGFHCSVCPRIDCEDRRETYALISDG